MQILTRWGFRMVRANRSRTITVFFAVVGFFALWTCAAFIADAAVQNADVTGSSIHSVSRIDFTGDYMFQAMVDFLFGGLLLVMLAILYSVFAVTADECLRDNRILKSSGATAWQLWKILLQRAIALDLAGAAGGIAVGLIAALCSDAQRFRNEIPQFFSDPRTVLMLAAGLLLAPCAMSLATARALWRKKRERRPRAPKRSLFHRSFSGRLFGVGGELGRLNSKKNLRYRVIFTLSFAVCLMVPALLDNTLLIFNNALPLQQNYHLSIECRNYQTSSARLGSDVLDDLLRQNADSLAIRSRVTLFFPSVTPCYVLLDSDRVSPTAPVGSTVVRNGRSMRLCRNLFRFVFLDDASFDRLAQANGSQAQTDGAIIYNVMQDTDQIAPLKSVDPRQDISLYFLPDYMYWWPDTDFLRDPDSVCTRKTIRILGLTQTLPFDIDNLKPAMLFPARMLPSFMQTTRDAAPDANDSVKKLQGTKRYFFTLEDPETGADAFLSAIKSEPRFEIVEELFGMGPRVVSEENDEMSVRTADPLAYVKIADLHAKRDRLELFQSMIPVMQAILLVTSGWILYVGVLNTAHMNRLTRRREKAILESIGMSRRQKTGMLVYESARYALYGTLLGLLGFFVVFRLTLRTIQWLLYTDGLLEPKTTGNYIAELFSVNQNHIDFPQAFLAACARIWWIFAVGAVLIFVLLVVTDMFIDSRSRREELIQILTDDSQDDSL